MVQIIDLTGIETIGNCSIQVAAMYAPKLLIQRQDQGGVLCKTERVFQPIFLINTYFLHNSLFLHNSYVANIGYQDHDVCKIGHLGLTQHKTRQTQTHIIRNKQA